MSVTEQDIIRIEIEAFADDMNIVRKVGETDEELWLRTCAEMLSRELVRKNEIYKQFKLGTHGRGNYVRDPS